MRKKHEIPTRRVKTVRPLTARQRMCLDMFDKHGGNCLSASRELAIPYRTFNANVQAARDKVREGAERYETETA